MVSILSERRSTQPYGMNGGNPAARGRNLLKICQKPESTERNVNANGKRIIDKKLSRERETLGSWSRVVNLGGKSTVDVASGDRLLILTPGGGGYGPTGATEVFSPWQNEVNQSSAPIMQSGSLHQHDLNQES